MGLKTYPQRHVILIPPVPLYTLPSPVLFEIDFSSVVLKLSHAPMMTRPTGTVKNRGVLYLTCPLCPVLYQRCQPATWKPEVH